MSSRIAKVLMAYRTTPQSTTGATPSELLQGRRIRTRLDLLKPSVNARVEYHQFQQKLAHDSSARKRNFERGDTVFARNFGTGSKWLPSVIHEVTGPVSFVVKLPSGQLVRRHQDHLRHRLSNSANDVQIDSQNTPTQEEMSEEVEIEIPVNVPPIQAGMPNTTDSSSPDPVESTTHSSTENVEQSIETTASAVEASVVSEPHTETSETSQAIVNAQPSIETTKRYPGRNRKPPDRYH